METIRKELILYLEIVKGKKYQPGKVTVHKDGSEWKKIRDNNPHTRAWAQVSGSKKKNSKDKEKAEPSLFQQPPSYHFSELETVSEFIRQVLETLTNTGLKTKAKEFKEEINRTDASLHNALNIAYKYVSISTDTVNQIRKAIISRQVKKSKNLESKIEESVKITKLEISEEKDFKAEQLKNAHPPGTRIRISGIDEEFEIQSAFFIGDDLVYRLTDGGITSSANILLTPILDPFEIDSKIQKVTPETRKRTRQEIEGTELTEKEATEKIETEEVKFNPSERKTHLFVDGVKREISALDYTQAPSDKIILFNEKEVLNRRKPSYLPDIDLDSFSRLFSFELPAIKLGEDEYLVKINRNQNRDLEKFAIVNQEVLAASEDYYRSLYKAKERKRFEDLGTNKKVRIKRKDEYSMSSEQFRMLESQIYKDTAPRKGLEYNRTIFDAYRKLRKDFEFTAGDIKRRTDERIEMSTYSKGKETSYGDSGTVSDLYDTLGVLVKRQNGSAITQTEIEQVQSSLKEVYKAFGDRSSMAKNFGLKISHSGKVRMHASNYIGLFNPGYKAIGVSYFDGNSTAGLTLAHEFGHFMDYYLGGKKGRHFASDKAGSIENKIASIFRTGCPRDKATNYSNQTCECFARACEMYFHKKNYGTEDYLSDFNPKWNYFTENVYPIMEQFFIENYELLKSFILEIAS